MAESQKIGRSKRRASTAAYKNGMRWSVNRDKRMARDKREKERQKRKWERRIAKHKPVRGTMRKFLRAQERARKAASELVATNAAQS